jgi:adhesin transport system outer membrane protein
MRKQITLLLLLASTSYAETLQQTLNEILETNPKIQERLRNYNATKIDITSAEAGYYPKIDLVLGGGQENTDRELYNRNYTVYENSLSYTHNLFNGFNTTYLVKEQEYRTLAAAYSYIDTVNTNSFDMTNSYLEVIKNQELMDTAVENVKIDQEILKKVKKLYKAGLTTLSEVNKIESSLALAQSNLVVQENNVLDAAYNLEKVLGRPLEPSKMTKPTIDKKNFPKTKQEAIDFALKNNPSLLVSEYNIKLAQATNKEKKSQFYPKLDVEVSQSLNNNVSAIKGKDNVFRAMAFVSYNFFNGFSDKAALQKSLSQIYQEVENKNSIKRDIIQNLNLSWAARQKLQEQLTHLIEYKDFSHKTLVLYSKEYALGRRSLLDLLSAQNDFIRAKAQIITTRYSILYAQYRILNTMGILLPTIMHDTKNIYANVDLNHDKE